MGYEEAPSPGRTSKRKTSGTRFFEVNGKEGRFSEAMMDDWYEDHKAHVASYRPSKTDYSKNRDIVQER